MATATITNDAVDNLRFDRMFDPDADLDYARPTSVSLTSDDGYRLLLTGEDFDFNRFDEPTDGTITDIYLYDTTGDLVARFDNVSYDLTEYYDRVVIDGQPSGFVSDLLSSSDQIFGSSHADTLQAYGGNDRIAGYGGNDLIDGGTGADRISGGSGNDELYGFDGDDAIYGDAGNDEIYGEIGNDDLRGGDGNDKILGGSGNDRIVGENGRDTVEGGSGNDSIAGGNDNDRLGGGEGNDAISGGAGDDIVIGDSGNDILAGGLGLDSLTGGSGDDTFRFVAQNQGLDKITDFDRGDDVLQFISSGFTNLTDNFGLAIDGRPTTSAGTFMFNSSTHNLIYDADGTGAGGAVFVARLEDIASLSRSDFDIV